MKIIITYSSLFLLTISHLYADETSKKSRFTRLKKNAPYCVKKLEEVKGELYWTIDNSCFNSRSRKMERNIASLHAQKKSPYCVDKVEENRGILYWSISNSCFMLKEQVRQLASVPDAPVQLVRERPKNWIPPKYVAQVSGSNYDTDIKAQSLAASVGYKHDLGNITLYGALELEKIVAVDSDIIKAKINKPMVNALLAANKRFDDLSLGIEGGTKHYLQFVEPMPNIYQFDITRFYFLGGVLDYRFNDNFTIGVGASVLKASDVIESSGNELKIFADYIFGKQNQFHFIPGINHSSIKNIYDNVTNSLIKIAFQFHF